MGNLSISGWSTEEPRAGDTRSTVKTPPGRQPEAGGSLCGAQGSLGCTGCNIGIDALSPLSFCFPSSFTNLTSLPEVLYLMLLIPAEGETDNYRDSQHCLMALWGLSITQRTSRHSPQ